MGDSNREKRRVLPVSERTLWRGGFCRGYGGLWDAGAESGQTRETGKGYVRCGKPNTRAWLVDGVHGFARERFLTGKLTAQGHRKNRLSPMAW